ncbi:MAG: SdrD B-like domain-containing protein, partial [Acidobacteriota bacterium]
GNLVWKDINNNGLRDAGEPGVDGVMVELIRDANSNNLPDDAVIASDITSGGGFYNFNILLPGNYFVRVAALNFAGGGMLAGCLSSIPTEINPNNDVDNNDDGLDSANPAAAGIVSGVIGVLGGTEPPQAIDGDGTDGNLTIDFGFYAPMNLGNLVWKDFNNNGVRDGGEPGVDGVLVELIRDANNNGQSDDIVIATQPTVGGGFYNFINLVPGNYFVRVAASNFAGVGALVGTFSSTTTNPNPNSDLDNDDNGLDSAAPQNTGIVSNLVTLISNTEPINDGDGPNGNLTVDFGFYSVLRLGNLVWKDNNNNGTRDGGEPGIDNVRVELYADRNGNSTFEPNGADAPSLGFVLTGGGGFYQFTGLLPGNYFVLVAASNFQNGQPLAGCYSSVPTESNPNLDVDNNDDGIDSANAIGAGIASGLVALSGNGEPDTAVDGDDRNGNLTVDFGFYPPLNLGNLVWKDYNNNGLKDASEPGVDGVTVELIRDANSNNLPDDAVIATTTTSNGGLYNFAGLTVGSYFVRVAASNFNPASMLAGCLSSTTTESNPNADIDNNDNGIDNPTPQTGGIVSGVITLSVGGEPAQGIDGDGTNGNLTIDFGFYSPMNLGNLVWKDFNNNGLRDAGEPGVDGVLVELIRDANSNNQPDDAVIATLPTSGGGFYNFTNLLPGNYFVRVAASNFTGGGALVGCLSSTVTEANPNLDDDNNDNGIDNPTPSTGGIVSGLVSLVGFSEPAVFVDGDGQNGNLTVDFGFYSPLNLGNLVWKDNNNNGLKDGGEPGVDGVTVELIRDANNNGQPDDAVVATLATTGGGFYNFTNLVPGNYFVRVAASNFTGVGALVGCLSSETTETNPNLDVDNNDNGLNNPTPSSGGIISGVATLLGNTEPANDGDGVNGNLTVDFGFIPLMNLGNLLWKDYNNNGLKDGGEPGVGGVTVELLRDTNSNGLPDDAVVATTTTSLAPATLGQYNFTGLVPGTYLVRVAGSNFTGAGMLVGCLSSTTTQANPNTDVDNDDNGVDNATPANGGVASGAVTLLGHTEPTNDGDGDNGNLSVDFGFYSPLNLGNLVWKDLNNDGLFNNNELGVNGVVAQLYRETNGTPGFQIAGDTLVATTTTANGGIYQFAGLLPGDYYVYLLPANFTGGGALAGCASSTVDATNPNNDTDNDDNGLPGPNGGIVTGGVTLSGNTEPTNDGDGPNGNQTVDMGFYAPVNLGNLVWKDNNNNGLKDASEPGVNGVLVELISDANNNGQPDDAVIATQATAGGGFYNFANLVPGTYFVRVAASNFTGVGALTGCLSSEPTETNPNLDVDNNDNGLNNSTPATGGIVSGAVALTGHGEPANDGDGDNGNLTVDFGFIPLMNLGNLVWKDNNNNGLKDASEPGMNGVTVQLYRDTNGNNQLDLGTDQLVSATTTAGGGLYAFSNLPPGNYFVYLPPSNFTGGGALAGCLSSTVDVPNANSDTDNDDNGLTGPNGGVVTGVVTLIGGDEPSNDGDGSMGNLTIDLGFYAPMNLGNLVWKDVNNDGLFNNGEQGMNGVLVELFRDSNNNGTFEPATDQPVDTTTTSGGGLYGFTNLLPGTYFVRVAGTNFQTGGALAGCLSSIPTQANANNDADNDDNGVDNAIPPTNGIVGGPLTLVSGSEPANDGDGANGNLTLDFGFYAPLTLGNLVWKDSNNNGLRDVGEPAMDGVTVELIRDANNNNQPDDAVIATTTTAGGGNYNFANLQPGNYFVRVAASNFVPGGSLAGCLSSTTTNPNPNSDIDNDDNGIDSATPQTAGIVSGVVTLAGGTEPVNDGDGNNANETIDFGFYSPLNLGNLVWKDNNNNGLRDAGEPGVDGVLVELIRDTNNNGTFEPGTDLSAGTTTTAGGGLYNFSNLLPGNYFVRVAPVNFQTSGALFGFSSSSVTNPIPNSDIDNDDNGIDSATPQSSGIMSGVVTLSGNGEPQSGVDGDGTNGNLTVDFGFITGSLSLGNLVWKDTNSNSVRDAGEPGIAGVTVELIRDANGNGQPDDAVIQTTTTNAQGQYSFTGLPPGNYFVRVATTNFVPGGVLYGCAGSPGTNPPDTDVDNDDNGSDSSNPAAAPPVSSVITLTQGGEPANDGDGTDSNQTVDFGFVTPISVTIIDPATCIGPGTVLQVEAVVLNTGAVTQPNNPGSEIEINLPPLLAAVAGSCTSLGGSGACTITGTQRVTWDGSYAPGERVVLRYKVQVSNIAQAGQQFCITTQANFDADNNGSNESQQSVTVCATVTCQTIGPGQINPGCSVVIYPVYTSSSTNPNLGNTRINLTNSSPDRGTAVHLFFVDGETCAVNDAYLCLTANQTTSFLASDLDPGVTGYILAVAVDQNGCPTNFNFLLGDEYVKFDTGHVGNLKADCGTAIPGGVAPCQVGSSTATLNFDGLSYSRLPQTVAASNLPDRASGNDTLLILDRISGSLATGMDKLGSILGLLYNDTETAYSFTFTPNTCQFRSSLSNVFPRTAPRYETVIPAGRSGWMKLSSVGTAMIGATINRNPNSTGSAGAFNGAHGLHTLTLNPSVSVTMPVFPPSCL